MTKEREQYTMGYGPAATELLKFESEELKLDYIFWCTEEPYYSQELIPFMRAAKSG